MKNLNQDFIPSFCPNPECRFHQKNVQDRKWFIRYSSYFHKKENKWYQRFMCLGCNKTFSERTFASDYCLKLDLRYEQLFAALKCGIKDEDWAETLGHSVSVIENRLHRLGRWLVSNGYISAHMLLLMQGWGLVRLGLVFREFWIKAFRPEHSAMVRCFLKQLRNINFVGAVQVWTQLSWCYRLTDDHYYRPAFTYN